MQESLVPHVAQLFVQRLCPVIVDSRGKADTAGADSLAVSSDSLHQSPRNASATSSWFDEKIMQYQYLIELYRVITGIELGEARKASREIRHKEHRLPSLQTPAQKAAGCLRIRRTPVKAAIIIEQARQSRRIPW